VVVLLWVYYAAQLVLFGAEFTQVYARTHGSKRKEATPILLPLPPQRERVPGGRVRALPVAASGFLGLLLGTFLGGIAAAVMLVKSLKKMIS